MLKLLESTKKEEFGGVNRWKI